MEVCANSLSSALAAQQGGASRVELCDNLPEGGTTPSYAQIALCKKMLHIEVYPIIRPRGGDFLYNDLEFELMKEDIKICKALNCDALEDVIETGCVRILSSGGSSSALKGVQMLSKLIRQAGERISIMPGAGITEDNIQEIISLTAAVEFHASARKTVHSQMTFCNPA
eukprot:gene23649-28202_t